MWPRSRVQGCTHFENRVKLADGLLGASLGSSTFSLGQGNRVALAARAVDRRGKNSAVSRAWKSQNGLKWRSWPDMARMSPHGRRRSPTCPSSSAGTPPRAAQGKGHAGRPSARERTRHARRQQARRRLHHGTASRAGAPSPSAENAVRNNLASGSRTVPPGGPETARTPPRSPRPRCRPDPTDAASTARQTCPPQDWNSSTSSPSSTMSSLPHNDTATEPESSEKVTRRLSR